MSSWRIIIVLITVSLLLFTACNESPQDLQETGTEEASSEEVQESPTPVAEAEPEPAPAVVAALTIPVSLDDSSSNQNDRVIEASVGNWQAVGALQVGVEDQIIISEILSTGGNSWEPKVFFQLPELVDGNSYTIRITSWAEENRKVHIKIGQQLSHDPWWIAQYEDATGIHELGTAEQIIETSFIFSKTANGSAYDYIMELGNVDGDDKLTRVYIKNIEIIGELP